MPVMKKVIFPEYPLYIVHWTSSSGWSERHTIGGYDPARTTINSVKCYVRVRRFRVAPAYAWWWWLEAEPCKEVDSIVELSLNGVKVLSEKVHVDKALTGEGKAYFATSRNHFRIALRKVLWLDHTAHDATAEVWIEVDYSGDPPNLETQAPPAPAPYDITLAKENPTYPWQGVTTPFLGEFSTLFLIVIVVLIIVLIISAIRR